MHLIKSVSGVRGIAVPGEGREVTLTDEVAADMGRAFATFLSRTEKPKRQGCRWIIGARDGRPGGNALLGSFAQGAWECGARLLSLDIAATPSAALAVAALAQDYGVCGGTVITASHNPQQWNGIKLLMDEGRAPAPAEAETIFDLFDRRDFDVVNRGKPTDTDPPPDAGELHVNRVLDLAEVDRVRGRGFRVVLDSVNGAGIRAGRMVLEGLGCTVVHLNDRFEGGFGRNPEPTAENLREFAEQVRTNQGDVGFAQDPDADRLAIIDETGRYIGEEYTLALAAKHVFATRPGPAVANLSTSRMLDDLAERAGGPCAVHRSPVGEAHVVQSMKQNCAVIGGEGNGGVIDPRIVFVRDSIASMAFVLELMTVEQRPLSQIVDDIPRYAIVKEKAPCDRDHLPRVLQAVRDAFADQKLNDLDGLRVDWPDRWVHIRGSNTEPIMRIIAEARDASAARDLAGRVQQIAERAG